MRLSPPTSPASNSPNPAGIRATPCRGPTSRTAPTCGPSTRSVARPSTWASQTRATRLADELATADAEAPARIASEFTPTQLITVIAAAEVFTPATAAEAQTGDPIAEPAVTDAARED